VIRILREFVVAESSVLQVRPYKKAMTFNRYERLLDLLHFLFPGRGERLALSPELEDLLDNDLLFGPSSLVIMGTSQGIRWIFQTLWFLEAFKMVNVWMR